MALVGAVTQEGTIFLGVGTGGGGKTASRKGNFVNEEDLITHSLNEQR